MSGFRRSGHILCYCNIIRCLIKHIMNQTKILSVATDNQFETILDDVRSDLASISYPSSSHTKTWNERMEQVDQSWEVCRSVLYEDVVSSMAMTSEAVSNVSS